MVNEIKYKKRGHYMDSAIKVLLIEDDLIDQKAFTRLIEEKNISFDYVIAGSVKEAKKLSEEKKFDVIVVDFNLGDGTAFDVFNFIKDTPMIIATGSGNESIAVKAMKLGAYDYLIKDYDRNYLKVLPITVNNALKYKKNERDRKKALEDLRKNEKIYRTIFETTGTATIMIAANSIISFANSEFLNLSGYTKKEIEGKIKWFKFVHQDDLKRIENYYQSIKYALKNPKKFPELESHNEFHFINKQNEIKDILMNIGLIPGTKRTIISLLDITERKKIEFEKEKLIKDLKNALDEVKTLSGLIPICTNCKKIRDDSGYWTQVEHYISKHSDVDFSHSICPDCMKKLYPKVYEKMKNDGKT